MMLPKSGLREVLGHLRARYRLAMATNRGRTTSGVVDHFSLHDYFELAVGALDVPRPKPYPDMLRRCLDHFGVPAHEAVYVGDQPGDASAAAAAEVTFVAMGAGVPDARHRIDDLRELPPLLREL
jgi:HAD superfamily hydrolase (TIGR01549 family)